MEPSAAAKTAYFMVIASDLLQSSVVIIKASTFVQGQASVNYWNHSSQYSAQICAVVISRGQKCTAVLSKNEWCFASMTVCVLVLHLIFLTHSLSLLLFLSPPPSLLTYFTEIHPLKCKHSYPLYHLVALIHAVAVKSRRTRVEDCTAFWRASSAHCCV